MRPHFGQSYDLFNDGGVLSPHLLDVEPYALTGSSLITSPALIHAKHLSDRHDNRRSTCHLCRLEDRSGSDNLNGLNNRFGTDYMYTYDEPDVRHICLIP